MATGWLMELQAGCPHPALPLQIALDSPGQDELLASEWHFQPGRREGGAAGEITTEILAPGY